MNIEVYIDDIVIKSHKITDFVGDLEETMKMLRQVGLTLNPTKCTFGVSSGKFLGHIISHLGLKANPEKTLITPEYKRSPGINRTTSCTGTISFQG